MCKNELYAAVKEILVDEFEVQSDLISPEKLLNDELDIDSLDAVDLLIYLKDRIGGKFDPALFKNAKTLQDIIDTLHPAIQARS